MWLQFSLEVKQVSPPGPRRDPPLSRLHASKPFWRTLLTPPSDGAWNMALDEALMEHARRTDEWVLRVYGWATPTLSFGRNQRVVDTYDPERLRRENVDVVRRPTGGRAILHWREITYSVVAPVSAAGDLRESYERINRLLVAGLAALGVHANVIQSTPSMESLGTAPCFHHPSVGELVVDDRKLVGSAQWRADGALLQHGSILVADDQALVASLASDVVACSPSPATLSDALGFTPPIEHVADALFSAVCAEDPCVTELMVDEFLAARARTLRERYTDFGWTWRR